MKILLLEDDYVDAMTVERAFKELRLDHDIRHVTNGEEAIAFLKSDNPDLILIDINMPRMNGIEFIAEKNKHDQWKKIPAVILTTSNNEKDLDACYELGISGYFVKPVDYNDFIKIVSAINAYWETSQRASL